MSEIKLLPCPFCGGSKLYIWERNYFSQKHSTVSCIECHVSQTGDGFKTREEAIKAWNTRKPMQEILEKLEGRAEQEMNKSEKAAELGKAYERHTILHGGKGMAFEDAIEIVKEVGGVDV